ncbi:MAG: DGQHR domain-containing protein [Terracidiphilus sp.]
MMAEREDGFIYFRCVEAMQPRGALYIGAMLYSQVLSISFADVRRIEARDIERYIGIQRTLDDKRVQELKSFVRTEDASFPTSVILALSSEDASYDPSNGIMRIRKSQDVARIIDGQHRIACLVNYSGPTFQLNVTILVDVDIEDQAHMFATINLHQTKVNRSLAYDLYEFATKRSPQKTSHNIAKLLNSQEGSPFFRRVKILGRASGRGREYLTQAAIVERVIGHISKNNVQALEDRDLLRRSKRPARATLEQERKGLFFRNMFIDQRDDDILLVEWNFFTAVASRWPTAWNTSLEGFVLNRSLGFAALSRILSAVYIDIGRFGSVPTVDEFKGYLDMSGLEDKDLTRDRYIPGSGGEALLFRELLEELGLAE